MTLSPELKGYESCTWQTAKRRFVKRRLMLAMEKDDLCVEIARTYDSHGMDAAMATLCAVLYLQKNGPGQTARQGVEMYWDIVLAMEKSGKKVPWLRNRVGNLRYWVFYACSGPRRDWPLEPPKWKNLDMVGGLANIMLWVGAAELERQGGTSNLVAAGPIARFLREGLERKREREVKDRRSRAG